MSRRQSIICHRVSDVHPRIHARVPPAAAEVLRENDGDICRTQIGLGESTTWPINSILL